MEGFVKIKDYETYAVNPEGLIKDLRTGKLMKQYKGDGGKSHIPNFINAIRDGSNKSLACEIEVSWRWRDP